MKRLERLGRLNVVVPSPTPYIVCNRANSAAYFVLDTACPLQRRNPVGAVEATHAKIEPTGRYVFKTPDVGSNSQSLQPSVPPPDSCR